MTGRAILTWVVLAAIGFANGVLRDLTYGRLMSDQRAHQLSTVLVIPMIFGAVYAMLRDTARSASDRALFAIGAAWTVTTVTFEFLFGRFVVQHSWKDLLHDWNVLTGRFWAAVPATILAAPLLTKRLAVKKREGGRGVSG